ncbi:nep-5 like spider venom protein Nep-737 [Trichonephila clavipes]|uniref:Nep-5 like spider venom protein Nep-737 n=1 Tax=Trichonephila clavipes TaxID=2585209 RepID=A0A8X6SUR2_TRICX|nr:nep-5 like spider venom protein Nep-737 [Trichonephila clavipes]
MQRLGEQTSDRKRIEVLPTKPHSALDTSTVSKSWKNIYQIIVKRYIVKVPFLFDFSSYICILYYNYQFTFQLSSCFIKITMKAYFCIMVALCVVLLSLQAVEMSDGARARRQSSNDNIVTLAVPQNILIRLLKALLGALGLGGILGR